jgi:hypothetical protein
LTEQDLTAVVVVAAGTHLAPARAHFAAAVVAQQIRSRLTEYTVSSDLWWLN